MVKIAIVDDNKDQRETNTIRLKLFLKDLHSKIEVSDIFPFEKFSDYYGYIESENIIALVIDEKLYNDSQLDKAPVEYNGSDLVGYIRERYKNIPIFTLTNFPDDPNLQDNIYEYDYIFSKKEFAINQVIIINRACQRYLEDNQKELSQVNDLTRKIASGKGDPNDIERLKALQIKLSIPFSCDLKDREEWLIEYEKQLTALEELKFRLEKKLNK